MNTYAVVIVAYNPDERIFLSVKKLNEIDSVDKIYIIDNTPRGNTEIGSYSKKIVYIPLFKNKGIAVAQNIGLDRARMDGYIWAMTLDQDMIIENELLIKYDEFIKRTDTSKIGLINTDYFDINSQRLKYDNKEMLFVDEVISSGSFINLDVFKKVGKMDESFFIDQVDNEYCYRLRKNGYSIVVLPGKGFEHRLGNIKQVSFGKSVIYTYNQPPIRVFYRTRNTILFIKKYHDRELRTTKLKELLKDFIRLWFEKKRILKIFMYIKGIIIGTVWRY